MANTQKFCKLCNKRILTHDKFAQCTLCLGPWHANCLPAYSPADFTYANNLNNNWSCPHCLKEIFPFNIIESNDHFLNTTNNQINLSIDIDALESMVYDPFDSNDNDQEDVFSDIDPDQNYLSEIRGNIINNSKYFYTSNHRELLANKDNTQNSTFLHLNIRSIPKNLDNFIATMHASEMTLDLIGFSETWLKTSNADCYSIQDYTHEFLTREEKTGGGVSIFINQNWTYKPRIDLNHNTNDYQLLWIEIDKDSSLTKSNLIVGVIYRSPGSDPTEFNEILQATISTINN
jgi:hypothetical protein